MYIDSMGRQRYTLKEKYSYYKALAEGKSKTSRGTTPTFAGKVACANKANRMRGRLNSYMNGYNGHASLHH